VSQVTPQRSVGCTARTLATADDGRLSVAAGKARIRLFRIAAGRSRLADLVRQAVVRTELTLGHVIPPVVPSRFALEVQRIEDPVLRLRRLTDDEQMHVGLGVVDERVREPGAGRKADGIARLELMHDAVEPDLRPPLDDIDELFLVASAWGKDKRRPAGNRS
jgi:hypothetical protein